MIASPPIYPLLYICTKVRPIHHSNAVHMQYFVLESVYKKGRTRKELTEV